MRIVRQSMGRAFAASVLVIVGFGASGVAYADDNGNAEQDRASSNSCAVAQAKGGHSYDKTDCAKVGKREAACYREAAKGAAPGVILKDPRATAAGAAAGCVGGAIWP